MGSLSRKLRRAAKNNKQHNVARTLSEAEYNAVVKEVKEYLIDDVLYDTLSVVVDIVQNNWGKMTKKDTRMKVFGALYKEKLRIQCKTHSTDNHALLVSAGIVEGGKENAKK